MNITAYDIAQRFVGVKEVPGEVSNPFILSMLQLDTNWPKDDEVPWCSAFVNYVAWLLRLPRSKNLMARSWLNVGTPIPILQDGRLVPKPGFDVVVFKRQGGPMAGHVGFWGGLENKWVHVLGGNQSNGVSVSMFPLEDMLGVRRLRVEP